VNELESLIDWEYYNPSLSNAAGTAQWTEGDAFSGVHSFNYWSSMSDAYHPSVAWAVRFTNGVAPNDNKTSLNYIWPVRGGL